ncbi:phospholipase C [Streptomyces tsukubensis]|uniref:phospholipase C n=1 Tax=Streptomyces tsukubensis TaxID=83656 RepID=A0A1V4A091_9ACTN|nr:alkaline phosphatase family protein [Streptomyces tsukubensis]OON71881.1 phospholipase [Streptomyces tsukubensis]QFR91833.1 phospholipase [Streptomyces tsukubensis]
MARDERSRKRERRRAVRLGALAAAAGLAVLGGAWPSSAVAPTGGKAPAHSRTATPVKHLVVIFDENISFDHYFATYPHATNEDGARFTASKRTPKRVDTLENAGLIRKNPNQYTPGRLNSGQKVTCDQNHNYANEQYAYNSGRLDKFVENTDSGKCSGNLYGEPGLVMDYYDGNTVTGIWNYAQHYAMSDRSFSDVYGPSSPGAINVISGNTHGIFSTDPTTGSENPKQTAKPDAYAVQSPDKHGVGTMINDPDPAYDDCSGKDHTATSSLAGFKGRNIGDLLNKKQVSWGWFQGGFRPGTAWDGDQDHYAKCADITHANAGGEQVEDYSPHHEPFQYYRSTANPHHLPPRSVKEIGHDGRANHQYDLTDFDAALKTANLPSVSYLKAPAYQDGHAGYSSPMDEQHFLTGTINKIQKSPQWKDTAVVLAYDDSDGWYDHAYAKITNGSRDTTKASSGKPTDAPACRAAKPAAGGHLDRCGPGPRQPLLVVSPYSKVNAVDHTPTQQSSIVRFIEDNWSTGRIGDTSFDSGAHSLGGLFDFRHPHHERVLLNSDGSVKSITRTPDHVPVAAAAAVDAAQYTTPDIELAAGASAGDGSVALATAVGGVVVLGGLSVTFALRRRRTRL